MDEFLSQSATLGQQSAYPGHGGDPFCQPQDGPGAPPVRTRKGWLTTFHAVWRDDTRGKNGWEGKWPKVYLAGLMLMDLENPWRIVGFCEIPLMVPTEWYETGLDVPDGISYDPFRKDVIFPGGMLLEDDGEVKIYYRACRRPACAVQAHVYRLIPESSSYS
mgnify:CR=1 FL=1